MKNGVEERVFFESRILTVFFSDFCDFGSILGGSRAFKIIENPKKSGSERILNAFGISERFCERFWNGCRDFGRILLYLGQKLEG